MKERVKRKRKKKIFLITYTILSLLFILFLKITNLIPDLYLLIISGIFLIFTITNIILIKKKKKIGYFFSMILLIIYIIITYYLGITTSFFSSFSKLHYNEETYLVIVLNDSPYQKINDLKNKSIGYIDSDLNNTNKALDKIDKSITKEKYDDYDKLFSSLNNNNIESILVEEAYYNIKSEEESLDNYRILHKIKIRSIITSENKEVDVTKDSFTIYISGIDTYGNIETISRSDVNILVTVNPTTKQILLTSIPRDSYVTLHNTTGYKDKLTHAGNYGVNMSIDTIEDLLGIDINYYFRVNFTTLEKVINSLGGVDVYSNYSFVSYIDNYQFYKGYNHMNGSEALAFSRERKSLPGGDIDRGRNQQAVIEALIRKVTSKEIIYNYTNLLRQLKGSFQTNFTNKDITKLIKKELENIGGWTITSNTILGKGEYNYTYSYESQKLYVLVLDEDSINTAIDLINKVINGETLEPSYNNSPSNIKNPTKVIIESETITEEKIEENEETKENITEDKETNEEDNPLEDILPKDDTDNNENNDTNSSTDEKENNIEKTENNNTEDTPEIPDEIAP